MIDYRKEGFKKREKREPKSRESRSGAQSTADEWRAPLMLDVPGLEGRIRSFEFVLRLLTGAKPATGDAM